jgi:hypothetical protein
MIYRWYKQYEERIESIVSVKKRTMRPAGYLAGHRELG